MKLVLAVIVLFALPLLPLFAEQFPEGPGKEILEKKCGACHDATQAVAGDGHTPEEWKDIVQEMIGMGAEIPEDQVTILIDYLSKNWPPKKQARSALGTKRRSTTGKTGTTVVKEWQTVGRTHQ